MKINTLQKNITHGWQETNLGSIANLYQPQTISKTQMSPDGEYLVFGANGIIGKYDRFNHEDSEVIVTCRGASCGSISMTPKKAWITGNAMVIKVDEDKVIKPYIYYFLNNSDLNPVISGGAQPQITRQPISAYKILFPESKAEQQKIVEILGMVDEDITKTEEVIKATEKLKRGLMQQIFTRGIGHTKFKETKTGQIPEEWEVVTIQKLIDKKIIIENQDGNHGGIHPKANDYVSDGIPFISASDVRDGNVDLKNCHFLSGEHAKKLRIGFAKEHDVLLTHKGSVGNVAILPKLNTNYVVLTPQVTYYRLNQNLIDGGYLSYIFQSDYFQSLFKSSSRQSTRDFLSITNQRKLMIPFTNDLNEQKKIAKILSAIDEKISVNKKLKENLTLLKKGLMQDLLSGKVRAINI